MIEAHSLPYRRDSSELVARLAREPWTIWLDSAQSPQGRYDIIASDPSVTLTTRGLRTEILHRRTQQCVVSSEDPFKLVRQQLRGYPLRGNDFPFCGGALGYFGYDLGRRIERLPTRAAMLNQPPELCIGIFDWAVLVDHHRQASWLLSPQFDPHTRRRWPELIDLFTQPPPLAPRSPLRCLAPLSSNLDYAEYVQRIAAIHHYIREGDCYQVNLAQRFSAAVSGDPFSSYLQLRQLNPAPYSAWLNLPELQILCTSPERYLAVRKGHVETRPIKGTLPRGATPQEDMRLAEALQSSPKDRAENLMIVDLLRNDLGKTCLPGSIRVPQLFALEHYASVHHLVSTITGKLAPSADALALLRGAFPGGSITGAPKLRAMEIIEELEPDRRGIYCGAIGYIGYDGAMDTNIVIRTLVHYRQHISIGAGGGIVADSQATQEYAETKQKVAPLLQLLE